MDAEIEALSKSFSHYQVVQSNPAKLSLHPCAWPSLPWQIVHVDFARPFCGR